MMSPARSRPESTRILRSWTATCSTVARARSARYGSWPPSWKARACTRTRHSTDDASSIGFVQPPLPPEPLWRRVETALVERRADRLPPQRRKGANVLTEILRCSCGSGMAGTCSRVRHHYRSHHDAGDRRSEPTSSSQASSTLIRRSFVTPDAIRQVVEILNSDLELRNTRRSGDHDRAIGQVRSLERQDSNLRRALRTAAPSAAERISVELDSVAGELREAKRRVEAFDVEICPYRIKRSCSNSSTR